MDDLHANTDASNNADENREQDMGGDVLSQLTPGVVVVSHLAGVVRVVSVTVLSAHASVLAASALHATHVSQNGGAPSAVEGGAVLGRRLVVLLFLVRRDGGLGLFDIADHEASGRGLDELDLDIGDVGDEAVSDLDDLEVHLDELKLLLRILSDGADAQAVTQLRGVGVGVLRVLGSGLCEVGNLRSTEGLVPRGRLRVELEVVDEEVVDAGGVGFDGEGELEMVVEVRHCVEAAIVLTHRQGAAGAVDLDAVARKAYI